MSIFSTQYSITTGTAAQRLIEDDLIQPVWSELPLKARVNDASITTAFKHELMLGFTSRVERMVTMAKDPDKYTPGMLDHTLVSQASGASETKAYLETLHSSAVSLDYHYLSSLNIIHAGYKYLHESQGYAQVGNQLKTQSVLKGYPVYLEHVSARINTTRNEPTQAFSAASQPEWELPANQRYVPWENPYSDSASWVIATTGNTSITFRLAFLNVNPRVGSATYIDWEENGVPENALVPNIDNPDVIEYGYSFEAAYGQTNAAIGDFITRYSITLTIDELGYDQEATYFMTKYIHSFEGLSQGLGYFIYEVGTNTIAALENVFSNPAPSQNFMPWVFFRKNYVSLAVEALEETTDYLQAESLLKVLGNSYSDIGESIDENPDIADVSQSFLMFGINIASTKPQGIKYLFEFFKWLSLDDSVPATGEIVEENNWIVGNNRRAITFSDNSAKMTLTFNGISTRFGASSLPEDVKIGDCTSSQSTENQQTYQTIVTQDNNSSDDREITKTITINTPIEVYTFRKWLTATRYREVQVANPQISYLLSDTTGTEFRDALATDESAIVIPLSHDMAREHFFVVQRRELYQESMHLITNAYIKTRLEWYETQFFNFVITAIAIVATVASLGTLGASVQGLYATILASVGNVFVAALLTAIIVVGYQYGLGKLFELAAEAIGSKWGTIGGVLLTVGALYASSTGSPTASQLTYAANGLMEASAVQFTAELAEMDELIEYERELYEAEQGTAEELYEEYGSRIDLAERVGLLRINPPYENAEQHMTRAFSGITICETMVNIPAITLENGLSFPDTLPNKTET